MSADSALSSTQPPTRAVVRVTLVGLLGNLILAGIKGAAGVLGNSQALVADAVHSLSDLATDAVVLVGVRFWTQPADEDHPYGHRRVETLVTAVIGGSLAAVGIGLGYESVVAVGAAMDITAIAGPISPPGWIAFIAALLSVAVKEGLFRWTRAEGLKLRSSALVANAWHHRSDALSSLPAAAAVAVAAAAPHWAFVDRIGAGVVSLFILKAAWDIARPALDQLIDRGAPPEVVDRIRATAMEVDGVRDAHAVRTRYAGSALFADLHIQVAPQLTVATAYATVMIVRRTLLAEIDGLVDVTVHLEPSMPVDQSGTDA